MAQCRFTNGGYMTTTTEQASTALCDKFTKADGKRGKPARDSQCAVCDTVWTDHFSEREPERGSQQPILHPEYVRVIAEPKRKRRPRAIAAAVVRKVADKVAGFIDPPEDEPESYIEPEPEYIDKMSCGHVITELQTVDGVEACQHCIRVEATFAKMRQWWLDKEMARTGMTQAEAEIQYEKECW